ncbi:MAG: type-F conjugative transfer system secretin TraK [Sulfurimonas sp.]|jgi:hypothetical protein
MLVLLKPLVSSLLLLISFTSVATAKEIPITQEVEISIPLGKFAVVEFPFKIESKNITSFLTDKAVNKNEMEDSDVENSIIDKPIAPIGENGNEASKAKPTVKPKPKSQYISITQNINSFTFFARKVGVLKMVVWGYDHPILLTIKVEKNDGTSLYQFVLPHSDSKEVVITEQGSHEKVINEIMVNLFNQTVPKGYKSNSNDENFESNGFSLRLNRQVVGKKYLGEEWIFTNNSKEQAIIHEESFYQKGIYGVSLETDSVKPTESVRIFIVRNASEKGQ